MKVYDLVTDLIASLIFFLYALGTLLLAWHYNRHAFPERSPMNRTDWFAAYQGREP